MQVSSNIATLLLALLTVPLLTVPCCPCMQGPTCVSSRTTLCCAFLAPTHIALPSFHAGASTYSSRTTLSTGASLLGEGNLQACMRSWMSMAVMTWPWACRQMWQHCAQVRPSVFSKAHSPMFYLSRHQVFSKRRENNRYLWATVTWPWMSHAGCCQIGKTALRCGPAFFLESCFQLSVIPAQGISSWQS